MADGIPTATGNMKWRSDGIRKILNNEKYMGDALLQNWSEGLLKKLQFTVYDDKLIFEFKSGMTIELKR